VELEVECPPGCAEGDDVAVALLCTVALSFQK
jgi:hypothetical protein